MTYTCHVTHQLCDCIGRCRVLTEPGPPPTPLKPSELRALADRIESTECTGVAATWCPVHGNCRCPRDGDGALTDEGLNDPGCPLHASESSHAEASLTPEPKPDKPCARPKCGAPLSEHDFGVFCP